MYVRNESGSSGHAFFLSTARLITTVAPEMAHCAGPLPSKKIHSGGFPAESTNLCPGRNNHAHTGHRAEEAARLPPLLPRDVPLPVLRQHWSSVLVCGIS